MYLPRHLVWRTDLNVFFAPLPTADRKFDNTLSLRWCLADGLNARRVHVRARCTPSAAVPVTHNARDLYTRVMCTCSTVPRAPTHLWGDCLRHGIVISWGSAVLIIAELLYSGITCTQMRVMNRILSNPSFWFGLQSVCTVLASTGARIFFSSLCARVCRVVLATRRHAR